MIYLASPYTHKEEIVRDRRFEQISEFTADLYQNGISVFCPIAYSHILATCFGLRGDWEFWKKLDCDFIDRCDEVWVCVLEGWRESVGVTDEIAYAKQTGKPVKYVYPFQDKYQITDEPPEHTVPLWEDMRPQTPAPGEMVTSFITEFGFDQNGNPTSCVVPGSVRYGLIPISPEPSKSLFQSFKEMLGFN